MFYEEQVRDGVLCYRSTPAGEWVSMSAERLTAMLLELRQRATVAAPQPMPYPYPVLTPAPQWVPQTPWLPPWTITCGGNSGIGVHAYGTVG
jgi:hypothetical protein